MTDSITLPVMPSLAAMLLPPLFFTAMMLLPWLLG